MTVTAQPLAPVGTVSAYVLDRISDLLNTRRIVVWFDGGNVFRPLLPETQRVVAESGGTLIDGTESELAARRSADAIDQKLGDRNGVSCLLVYLPRARARKTETWREDLFAGYGVVGATFGDHEAEHLRELALAALPAQRAAIEQQFVAGQPTLASLDGLARAGDARLPLVQQALGTDDPVEAIVRFLRVEDADERLDAIPGAGAELRQTITSALGLSINTGVTPAIDRERLLANLLLSELAHDLPDGLPAALARVDHAIGAAGDTAREVLAQLRESDAGRGVLSRAAASIEKGYQIAQHLPAKENQLGTRDTFPVQDNLRLRAVVELAEGSHLAKALRLASIGNGSLWREDPERSQLWAAVGHCLAFLELANELQPRLGSLPSRPAELIEHYIAEDGLWRLDQAQRRFEQGAIVCHFDDDLEPLVQRCRGRYLELIGVLQSRFQRTVKESGWPPEGVRRQTRIFDERVAPELQNGGRVAWFLIDSFRYEMSQDLRSVLQALGSVTLDGVATALPTSTPVGMAALLPGADGALRLVAYQGKLVPAIGDSLLPNLETRREYLRQRYGDRVGDIELGLLIHTPPKRLEKVIGDRQLLVVRSLDIDDEGEGRSLYRAREVMDEVIGQIKRAIEHLRDLGYATFVIAADHGHMLVPEIPAGDVIPEPSGEWLYRKRRAVIGTRHGSAAGSLVLPAVDLGIQTDPPGMDVAYPTGYKTYRDDAGYFHEGLSLQECVIPVITLRADAPEAPIGGSEQVGISYRSDRFTTTVVGLTVQLTSLLTPKLPIRLEAYGGSTAKAERVGQAADCDARDPITGEVTLRTGETTPVPVLIDPDFNGKAIEIRAIDPRTNVVLARLPLKNARLD